MDEDRDLPRSKKDERERLLEFFDKIENLLSELVTNEDYSSFFDPKLIHPMREAWGEMGPYFTEARDALRGVTASTLRQHGLLGKQLDFKLAVVKRLLKRFEEARSPKSLVRLLGVLDDVLKSILDAAGVGGAIDEIKAMIKGSVEDRDDSEL